MSAMRGLGRGLDKLIPTDTVDSFFDPTAEEDEKDSKLVEIAIDEIIPQGIPVEIIFVPSNVKKTPRRKEKPTEEIALMQEQLENLKQMQSFCALNLKYTLSKKYLFFFDASKQ